MLAPRTASLSMLCVALVISASAGCDNRTVNNAADGGSPISDSSLRSDGPGAAPECVVAVRVDTCCAPAKAVLASEADADECLMRWPASPVPATCRKRWPKECELVDCATAPPSSRVATFDPVSQTCQLADECSKAGDCVLARNVRHCCDCGSVWPRAAVDRDACLVGNHEGEPQAGACPGMCAELIHCKGCPEPANPPTCLPATPSRPHARCTLP